MGNKMILLVLALISDSARAEIPNFKGRLETEIRQSRIKADDLGVVVSFASEGSAIKALEINGERVFIPASTTKIITAGAVLENLGAGKKFETQLLSAAAVKGGELAGDLILKGDGDPGFVSETMWFLVNEFTRSGVKRINGDIVVDESKFDSVRSDSSRISERVDRAYDAPVGAMSFNWNSVNVFVRPGQKTGDAAVVVIDPENDFVKLVNKAKTGRVGVKNQISVDRDDNQGKDEVVVTGTIAADSEELVIYKNITDPTIWSGANLVSFLKQRGITVSGKVRRGSTPNGAKLLAKAESKPVAQMVADMMKFSNNFVAEMLVKNMAALRSAAPATLGEGVHVLREFVVNQGISQDRFTLVNPSGLSRENRIRPIDLHEILVKLRKKFTYFPENLAAYPLAGLDGTLKSRMRNTPAQGLVRAKTGQLNGVAGLAGYAGRKDGLLLTFVFLFNGKPNLGEDARALFDRMAVQLVQ